MANELERLLRGLKPEEEVIEPNMSIDRPAEVVNEQSIPKEIAGEVNQANLEQVNQDAKSPNLQTKEEQFDSNQEYADLIKRYKGELDAPKKERDWQEYLPDALAGAHNILNYAQGSPQKAMKLGNLQAQDAKAAASKKAKLGTMKDLAGLLKGYKDKKNIEGKVYQTRSGLVQIKDGVPTPIYEDPYMKSTADVREKSLELRKDKYGFSKEVKGRLSDKEVETINALDEGSRIFSDIEEILTTTNVEDQLGPISSKMEQASKYMPGMEMSPDFVKTQQLVGIQLADYIKSISGAAVSEQEAARLLKNIPSMSDNPGEFKVKLKQIKKELEESKKTYLGNIGKQKSGAKKFQEVEKKDNEIRRATKDGRIAIFNADTKEFIKYE